MNRVYYKCKRCLGTYAVDFKDTEEAPRMYVCGICGQTALYMGKVAEDKLHMEAEKEVCKCDARCTNASGPICKCECHSANHGSGVAGWTTVKVIEEIPTLLCNNRDIAEKHRKIADDVLEAEVKLKSMIDSTYGTEAEREANWQLKHSHRQRISSMLYYIAGKSHKLRMTNLLSLEKEVQLDMSSKEEQRKNEKGQTS